MMGTANQGEGLIDDIPVVGRPAGAATSRATAGGGAPPPHTRGGAVDVGPEVDVDSRCSRCRVVGNAVWVIGFPAQVHLSRAIAFEEVVAAGQAYAYGGWGEYTNHGNLNFPCTSKLCGAFEFGLGPGCKGVGGGRKINRK